MRSLPSRHNASRIFSPGFLSAFLVVVVGCINISIYFPEAEVREAAKEIVDEVRPAITVPEGKSEVDLKTSGAIWSLFRPRAAYAEATPEVNGEDKKVDLEINSAVIKKIKATLKARYPRLLPFYDRGAIGENKDGYLALKDTEALPLKEKRDIQALLKDENDDRKSLYTEIVKSNAIEVEYVARVGQLFSQEWQKKSKPGWWIETGEGKWEKKAENGKSKNK